MTEEFRGQEEVRGLPRNSAELEDVRRVGADFFESHGFLLCGRKKTLGLEDSSPPYNQLRHLQKIAPSPLRIEMLVTTR